jgi:hypothetical protein
MYQVDNNDNVAYTRYQLQTILPNEVKPPLQREQYAQEVLGEKTIKKKKYYIVKWEDGETTEQEAKLFTQQAPDLVKEYQDKKKKKKGG